MPKILNMGRAVVCGLCATVLGLALVATSPQVACGQPALAVDSIGQALVENHPGGAVIGLLRGDTTAVHAFGAVDSTGRRPTARTVFEIGSVTKTFTGLLLADAIERGEVGRSTSVTTLLPDSVTVGTADSTTMTLGHLATHRSGLPRLPSNLGATARPGDPYAAYGDSALYAFLDDYTLSRAPGAKYEYSNLGMGLLGHLLARRADAVTAPSRTTKTRVREHGGAGDDVRVVPESIDFDLVERAGVDDRFDAVYARRLDRHANVETFLLGLAELRGRDWTAAVVGDGPERARIEAVARDLRIADRVSFLGDLPLRERVELFKGTHVAAATAAWETFPTDLLWALACGCVALVEYQADSSAHELVEGRRRGRLVTSPAELADEFVAVAGLDRKSVERDFVDYDHDAVLDRVTDLYRDLLDES